MTVPGTEAGGRRRTRGRRPPPWTPGSSSAGGSAAAPAGGLAGGTADTGSMSPAPPRPKGYTISLLHGSGHRHAAHSPGLAGAAAGPAAWCPRRPRLQAALLGEPAVLCLAQESLRHRVHRRVETLPLPLAAVCCPASCRPTGRPEGRTAPLRQRCPVQVPGARGSADRVSRGRGGRMCLPEDMGPQMDNPQAPTLAAFQQK